MRVYRIMTVFFFLAILIGCGSFKGKLYQNGTKNEVIHNAILDFSNTSKLYKRDSVFYVSFQDTLYSMVLKQKEGEKHNEWVPDKPHKGIVAVSIGASYDKMLLTTETKVGSEGKLPSRYVENDGKLFYWWDNDYPLTKEALTIFHKYNLLQDDEDGTVLFPDFITDDAQKGTDYYFCRNDLTKYKKVITNKGMGYYEPPKLDCP